MLATTNHTPGMTYQIDFTENSLNIVVGFPHPTDPGCVLEGSRENLKCVIQNVLELALASYSNDLRERYGCDEDEVKCQGGEHTYVYEDNTYGGQVGGLVDPMAYEGPGFPMIAFAWNCIMYIDVGVEVEESRRSLEMFIECLDREMGGPTGWRGCGPDGHATFMGQHVAARYQDALGLRERS